MKNDTRGLRYFSRLTVIITIAVLGFSLPGYGNSYSLISDQPVNAPLSAQMAGLPAGFPSAWRSRAVALNPVIASSDILVPGDVITLNLFADTALTAKVDRVSENVNGTVTVRGRIKDYPLGYLIISTTNNNSLASIQIPETGERYRIQMDTLTGIHYLLEENTDQLNELEDGPSPIPPTAPQNAAEMKMLADNVAANGPLDPVNLDVMIVYTPMARQWADNSGGGIANVIAQAVAKGQLALDNSNTIMTIYLVHSTEVSYTESGSSYTDLDRLTGTSDGYMDEVHTLRNQYGADIVGLFTQVEDTGGLGWLLNTTSGDPAYAFSISRVQQAGWTYTYIHEMGHNMGCHHYKWQATQPGPGLFSYSAGWRWVVNSVNYCSVMSYDQDGSYSGTELAYFSNPNVYDRGVATGNAADGDNARTIREVKNVIAAYRSTAPHYNDMFANAITMSGTSWQTTGRNIGATKESGEPSHAGNAGGASVWWYWTAPSNGQITIDTFGSNFDTLLAVYTGSSVGSLTLIASNDDSDSPQSQVTFTTISGTTYRIAVDGHDGAAGNIILNLYAAEEIFAWGDDANGQCTVPSPSTGFVAIAAGQKHSLALRSDGSILAWGDDEYGQCIVPSPNTSFVAIAASWGHSLGLKTNGSIVAWGYNGSGQCTVPSPNTGFTAVTAGWFHSLGLKADGSIVAWGQNNYGQCTVPSPNTGFVAIAAGYAHSLGLKQDGSIVAWGNNEDGQCTVPSPNTGFTAITANGWHSLGLKQDSSIVAWGSNGQGQCTVPLPNTGFTAISAGDFHSLGLKTDSSIVAWGNNYYGQCTVPLPNTGFTAISAGENHSLGLKGCLSPYTLTVNSSGTPSVSISSSTGYEGTTNYTKTVVSGTIVTLTAPSMADEKIFAGWTGNVTSSNQTILFLMTEDKTVTANFVPFVNLTMAVSPSEGGTTIPSIGTSSVEYESAIPIEVYANANYSFISWTASPSENVVFGDANAPSTTATLSGDATITANLLPPVELTMAMSPAEGGATIPSVGSSSVVPNVAIPIRVYNSIGYSFISWTASPAENAVFGDPNSSLTTVTISDDTTVTANFNTQPVADINATVNVLVITDANSVTLDATGSTDDGLPELPGILTYHWEKVSGPNTYTIVDPNAAITNVLFWGLGSYDFSVTVSDGQLQGVESVTIDVVVEVAYVANDGNDNTGVGAIENPFATIQKGINTVQDNGMIIVLPGTYYENINFGGRKITVRSDNPDDVNVVADTVIDANGSGSVVIFNSGEDANSVLSGFTITNGNTELGGGIYIDGASPIIEKNVITGNSASSEGGGIYCLGDSATIRYNKISNNYSVFAGGVSFESSFAVLQNNLIIDNSADYDSGVVCIEGQPRIVNNTIADNTAVYDYDSSGLVIISSLLSPIISNNIIAFNYGAAGVVDFGGLGPSYFSYNDVYGHPNGEYLQMPDQTGLNGNISVKPLFADIDANDYHLLPESLLIDAGDLSSDWSSEPRPNGGRINMGAYGNTSEASCSVAGDITWDKKVDFKDFAKLAFYWLQNEPSVDIAPLVSGDNIVDIKDLAVLAEHWLK